MVTSLFIKFMEFEQRQITQLSQIGGRLCLDFVNTVGGREKTTDSPTGYKILDEKINDYLDLLAWSKKNKLLPDSEIQKFFVESQKLDNQEKLEIIVKQAIGLRESIYQICKNIIDKKSPNSLDIEQLNQILSIAYSQIKLKFENNCFFWDWKNSHLEKILWLVTDSAVEMLTLGDLSRLRECNGNDCCWLFEDTSKNKARHWCDMQTCGNLAKVRRFRSKTKISKKPSAKTS
jgi:predicted RNA-binding Zn ribbon-like protein